MGSSFFSFELARDGGDMQCIAAISRVILNIGFHLLFDVRVIKGFDAGSKSFLNLLLVKAWRYVGEFVSLRGMVATAARWIGGSSNHGMTALFTPRTCPRIREPRNCAPVGRGALPV